ncbi:MAG TPA: hypothetical protein VFJ19_09325 [Nocardioidaceae bacterium]|nr:hypothetical protein [Nocardioidaceae bacterium]
MSLRDGLSRHRRRRTHYDLVLDDCDDAQELVDEAARELRTAKLAGDEAAVSSARAALDAARAELLTHVCRITFEAIPLPDWEELREEHPPSEDQLAKHKQAAEQAEDGKAPPPPAWNPDTLIPALFARCVVVEDGEKPLTETEWAAELAPDGKWQEQEKGDALAACLSAILVPRSVRVPKG